MNEQLLIWEQEQIEKEQERYEPRKKRRPFDPCKERLFKRRAPKWYRCLETPDNRKMWQRHVRTMSKSRIYNEDDLHIVKHEYHTGGWLSW